MRVLVLQSAMLLVLGPVRAGCCFDDDGKFLPVDFVHDCSCAE